MSPIGGPGDDQPSDGFHGALSEFSFQLVVSCCPIADVSLAFVLHKDVVFNQPAFEDQLCFFGLDVCGRYINHQKHTIAVAIKPSESNHVGGSCLCSSHLVEGCLNL